MKRALLDRIGPNTKVTFGAMCDAETRKSLAATLELPWKGNAHGISCIPAGTYVCRLRFSPKHNRNIYQLLDVPGRDNVEIHVGNTIDDTEGCLIVGSRIGRLQGEQAVLESSDAFEKFMAWAGGEDFELVISDPEPESQP